jgi:hypothetical protein
MQCKEKLFSELSDPSYSANCWKWLNQSIQSIQSSIWKYTNKSTSSILVLDINGLKPKGSSHLVPSCFWDASWDPGLLSRKQDSTKWEPFSFMKKHTMVRIFEVNLQPCISKPWNESFRCQDTTILTEFLPGIWFQGNPIHIKPPLSFEETHTVDNAALHHQLTPRSIFLGWGGGVLIIRHYINRVRVNQQPPVHHPFEAHYDSVLDEPQLC